MIRGTGSICGGVNIRYIYVMNTDTVLDVMNIISLRSLFISNLLADAVLVRASVQNTYESAVNLDQMTIGAK